MQQEYYIEDGPPATILEVNSQEYTEESMSVLQNDQGSSFRRS